MLMKPLLRRIRDDINDSKTRYENYLAKCEDKSKYLVNEEARFSEKKIKRVLDELEKQVAETPEMQVTAETAKPLCEFLTERAMFFMKGPAHIKSVQNSTTNVWCIKLADRLSDGLNCDPLTLFIPSFKSKGKIRYTDLHKYMLNDDETNVIDVSACLKNAFDDDCNPQLKHTHYEGKVAPPLSEAEAYRVINCCDETKAIYATITNRKKMRRTIEMDYQLKDLQVVLRRRTPFLTCYQEAGNKQLIQNLFPHQEALIEALTHVPADEWSDFLSNFELQDLSTVILQVSPTDSTFKSKLQSIIFNHRENDDDIYYDAKLEILLTLYRKWLDSLKCDEFEQCVQELDILMICNRYYIQEENKDQDIQDQDKNDVLSTPQMIPITDNDRLTVDVYFELKDIIRDESQLTHIIKNEYIQNPEDMIAALKLLTPNDDNYLRFLSKFSYEDLCELWFGEKLSHPSQFLTVFKNTFTDDKHYKEDTGYNRHVERVKFHLYDIWRSSQEDKIQGVLGWKLGWPKYYKLVACRFNQHFLISQKQIDKYEDYMRSYLTENNKSLDVNTLKDVLSNGTMLWMTNRMKQVLDPEYKPIIDNELKYKTG